MAGRKRKKRATRIDIIAEGELPEPLENLRLRLSSPRLRAPGTIKTYMETAERFVRMLKDKKKPTDNDLRRYFMWRREQRISDRTLKKEFSHLKKLCESNKWDWPFVREDVPLPKRPAIVVSFNEATIQELIASRKRYTEAERFYLAISTTFGCRREELANIERRDITDETLMIWTAKHGQEVKHLIPVELRKIFDAYRPKKHQPEAMTQIFWRIAHKAKLDLPPGSGWHSIRRGLRTLAEPALAKNNIPLSFWADFQGWSSTTKGTTYAGAPMMGVYSHPEILSNDPFYIDNLIYPVHPFLPLWKDEELTQPSTRRRKIEKATSSPPR